MQQPKEQRHRKEPGVAERTNTRLILNILLGRAAPLFRFTRK
jgi:hypothetical protein